MTDNLTEIVAIVDASGSMHSLISDVIGGLNEFIDGQKKIEGEANFTLITFDASVKTVMANIALGDVPTITEKHYEVGGMTTMNDAIGQGIVNLGNKLKSMPEDERPGTVVVAIMTDGQENRSKEYTRADIKKMIEIQENDYQWEFIFMAANMDAGTEGMSMGITPDKSMTFGADSTGMRASMSYMSKKTTEYRTMKK